MSKLSIWIKDKRQVRREQQRLRMLQKIRDGECICDVPVDRFRHDCPMAPIHYKEMLGYRTFRCENGHLVMQKNWPINCGKCGTYSFDEVDVQEMVDFVREELLEHYT